MPVGGTELYRHLQQKLSKVVRRRLPTTLFENGALIPTIVDLKPGARTVIQDQILEYGEAKLLAPEADDIPLMEVAVTENEYRVVMAVSGVSVSFSEARAVQMAAANGVNYNVRDIKMTGARRVLSERQNKIAAYGDSQLGFTGMVNDANVTLTDSSFDPYDVGTTAQDLADFVLEEIEDIAVDSNNVEAPTELLCSVSFGYLLKRRTMPDSGIPVLDFILDVQSQRNNPIGIKRVTPTYELNSSQLEANGVQASSTNKDRFVLYPLDPEVLERHIELPQLFPPEYEQVRGTRRIFPMFACTSQTIINFPGALRYVDAAKKA